LFQRFFLAHNLRFNYALQLEIDCLKWALKKIEVNKIPNDRLDGLIRRMIKDLEKKKDKNQTTRKYLLIFNLLSDSTATVLPGKNILWGVPTQKVFSEKKLPVEP
jgi:hypothetical protein